MLPLGLVVDLFICSFLKPRALSDLESIAWCARGYFDLRRCLGSSLCVMYLARTTVVGRFAFVMLPYTYVGAQPGFLGSTILYTDLGQKGNL